MIYKAITILAVTLATSACNTKQQTMAIYANAQQQAMQQQAVRPLYPTVQQPQLNTPEAIIEDYEKNRLNCGDAFVGVADCRIVTGRN